MKRYSLPLILLAIALAACSSADPEFAQSGLPDLRFFRAGGTTRTPDFLSPAATETLDAIEADTLQGDLTNVVYRRLTGEELENKGWEKVSLMRARDYAEALAMLEENGIQSEVTISASLVDGYLKHHNDLLYAAAERALSREIPGFPTVRRETLSKALADGIDASAPAGLQVISHPLRQSAAVFGKTDEELDAFWRTDPFQFKPISFYSNDSDLRRIWIADRMLLNPLPVDTGVPTAFNQWFPDWNDPATREAFLAFRGFFGKLTNRPDPALFDNQPLSRLINAKRQAYMQCYPECVSLWPWSSPGVLERLPGNDRDTYDALAEAQPDMETLIDYIQNKGVSFQPTSEEGFFIHQRYALETLLTFSKLPEQSRVTPTQEILDVWEEAFKAGTAKALETHQKVVDNGGIATSAGPGPVKEVMILDPIPTLYLRYAGEYRFLRGWIRSLPASFLEKWLVGDENALDLVTRLEKEMLGCYLLSIRQLRMTPSEEATAHLQEFPQEVVLSSGVSMLKGLSKHPAMTQDQRIIAVQGRPGGAKEDKCHEKPATFWTTLGVEAVPVRFIGTGKEFYDSVILLDHFAELKVCVGEPLTRTEWRTLLSESQDTS